MKCIGPLTLGILLMSGPARAATEFILTAGGGVTGELAWQGCVDEIYVSGCPAEHQAGVALLGAGIARVSDIGVRGSLKLETSLSFGRLHWGQAQILGAAGWQGRWLIVEGGLGSALLLGGSHSGATPGGVLHSGLGVRILRPLAVMGRADVAISDEHQPYFLGLALEWLPFRGLREGP